MIVTSMIVSTLSLRSSNNNNNSMSGVISVMISYASIGYVFSYLRPWQMVEGASDIYRVHY